MSAAARRWTGPGAQRLAALLAERWRGLAPRDRKALALCLAFLAVVGLYVLALDPLVQRQEALSARKRALLASRETYRSKTRFTEARSRKLEETRQDLARLSAALDLEDRGGHTLAMAINEVSHYARSMGLAVDSLTPMAPADKGVARELPMELAFHGDFEALRKFLYYLETSPSVFTVSDLSLSRRQGELAGRVRLRKTSLKTGREERPDEGHSTLKVLAYPWIGDAPLYIARAKGWLDEGGQHIRLVTPLLSGEQDSVQRLLAAGEIDASISLMSRTASYLIEGLPVRIVAPLSRVRHALTLLAASSSDIRTLADLRGRPVYMQSGGIGHFALFRAMEAQGLSLSQVRAEQMAPKLVAQSLAAGLIEAGVTWDRYAKTLVAEGVAREIPAPGSEGRGHTMAYLLASRQAVEGRPAAVQALVDAVFRALSWWADHYDEGLAMVAESVHLSVEDLFATRMDVDFLRPGEARDEVCGPGTPAGERLARDIAARQGFFKAVWGSEMDIPVSQVTDWRFLRRSLGCGPGGQNGTVGP